MASPASNPIRNPSPKPPPDLWRTGSSIYSSGSSSGNEGEAGFVTAGSTAPGVIVSGTVGAFSGSAVGGADAAGRSEWTDAAGGTDGIDSAWGTE